MNFGILLKKIRLDPAIPLSIIKVSEQSPLLTRKMSKNKTGLSLHRVVDILEEYASISLAEKWDNVGLLIEPTESKLISHVLLTNDLTEDVMQEAIELCVDMIISYHPPIFAPLKSVSTKTWKERVVAKCLENRIAVYSPHTSFDSITGGVNDWLAASFDFEESLPIKRVSDYSNNGMGRLITLKNKITIEEAVELVKKQTQLQHVRLARGRSSNGSIHKIALCPGSGASLLKGLSADLFVTGEMLHHDILDAVHAGTSVILTNHSDSERGFLKTTFLRMLTRSFDDLVTVSVSQKDQDPLKTV